ncbi:unnamed protein product [Rotaria sordida]|uniref:Peptidase S9 prolyl oligopeptidase catalytic domain-containing protein n=1 Tax=Rotaria sordida TaxID=392033 RepID=A0A814N772_9BILA|nr:unnamed protein product [Rotaria sordida]CAF1244070.1 unnamed protein product [Rotaria sordida]
MPPTTTGTTPPTTTAWNISDYQSNTDYYNSLSSRHNFDQSDNLRLDRLSSPRFHPIDGRSIIYLRRQSHMPDVRQSTTTLHWLDLEANNSVQLTRPIWGIHDQQFFWVNNNTILFLSNRASSGLSQIFQLNLPMDLSTTDFIDPIQITNYPLNIDNLLVNQQASRLAFSCQVYPNLTINQTVARQAAEKASGRSIYQFDKLFIRHWDEYRTGPRHHPFVVSIGRQSSNGIFSFSSDPLDVLFNVDSDSPTRPFGDAQAQWSFSSSGDWFAYTRQYDETSEVAWSTNLDIFTVNLNIPGQKGECITCENVATDTDPFYSPTDDSILVYRSHSVPGYESDQYKVKVYNATSHTTITLRDDWDQSIQAVTWSLDGESLYLEIGEEASNVIYHLSDIFTNQSVVRLIDSGTSRAVNLHPIDNQTFVFTHGSILKPTNIYLYSSNESIRPLTNHNNALLSKVLMSTVAEKFSFAGAQGDTVWGWHVPPVNGTPNPAPLAFLIHGGPQNSWYDSWGSGWNFQSFSSQGFAVIAINFHGSDSYGQNFTDSITGQYGSLPYEDLQLGLTYALNSFTYIDPNRTVALGASYGGYMINWIAGQSEMNRRFRTFVNHNGLFDMRAMGYSTEELWFTEHDVGGYTPYDNPDAYERYNPVNYVTNWTQPMLIIVGAHDYRVPETQGIGAFTALQRRGIESRLLYFPTENHWILNSQHSIACFDLFESKLTVDDLRHTYEIIFRSCITLKTLKFTIMDHNDLRKRIHNAPLFNQPIATNIEYLDIYQLYFDEFDCILSPSFLPQVKSLTATIYNSPPQQDFLNDRLTVDFLANLVVHFNWGFTFAYLESVFKRTPNLKSFLITSSPITLIDCQKWQYFLSKYLVKVVKFHLHACDWEQLQWSKRNEYTDFRTSAYWMKERAGTVQTECQQLLDEEGNGLDSISITFTTTTFKSFVLLETMLKVAPSYVIF